MSSYIGSIADAVATALSDASLSQEFTAERVYIPETDYANLGTDLLVQVIARGVERTRESRSQVRKEIEVDVLYMKRVEYGTDTAAEAANTELDEMLQLGEEIADVFSNVDSRFAGVPCLTVESDPIYDFDVLRSHRVFAALIKAFFPKI